VAFVTGGVAGGVGGGGAAVGAPGSSEGDGGWSTGTATSTVVGADSAWQRSYRCGSSAREENATTCAPAAAWSAVLSKAAMSSTLREAAVDGD
jgi:hypothetical protein